MHNSVRSEGVVENVHSSKYKCASVPIFPLSLLYILSSNNLSNHSAENAEATLKNSIKQPSENQTSLCGRGKVTLKTRGNTSISRQTSFYPPLFQALWMMFLLLTWHMLFGGCCHPMHLTATDLRRLVRLTWIQTNGEISGLLSHRVMMTNVSCVQYLPLSD